MPEMIAGKKIEVTFLIRPRAATAEPGTPMNLDQLFVSLAQTFDCEIFPEWECGKHLVIITTKPNG